MIEKLVLCKGNIETLGYFSEQMKPTFEKLGYKIFMFDFSDPQTSIRHLKKFIVKGRTALITFNFIGLDDYELFQEKNRQLLWDVYDVLCINIMVDHPFYYHEILERMPKRSIQLCIDRDHLAYVQRFFPQITNTGFLPLAGTQYDEHEHFIEKPFEERKMDIVFTGNYANPKTFEKHITRVNEEYTKFYYEIINDLIEHPWLSIDKCMEKHLMRELEDEKTEDNLKDAMATMIFIDLYVRMHFRGEVVKTLVDHGFKVDVIGAGWENLECRHPENLIMHKECKSADCLKYIQNAKISLNVMPWFKDGAHDRIFNTMMNKAVVLTDSSKYLEEQYHDQTELFYYRLDELDKLPEVVRTILNSTVTTKQIIHHAFERTCREHTWKQRAETIHSMLLSEN
ncbi:MAG: glycosyltransferase [bacterium]|nr:glycosyltransferase [bacterium]